MSASAPLVAAALQLAPRVVPPLAPVARVEPAMGVSRMLDIALASALAITGLAASSRTSSRDASSRSGQALPDELIDAIMVRALASERRLRARQHLQHLVFALVDRRCAALMRRLHRDVVALRLDGCSDPPPRRVYDRAEVLHLECYVGDMLDADAVLLDRLLTLRSLRSLVLVTRWRVSQHTVPPDGDEQLEARGRAGLNDPEGFVALARLRSFVFDTTLEACPTWLGRWLGACSPDALVHLGLHCPVLHQSDFAVGGDAFPRLRRLDYGLASEALLRHLVAGAEDRSEDEERLHVRLSAATWSESWLGTWQALVSSIPAGCVVELPWPSLAKADEEQLMGWVADVGLTLRWVS